MKSTFRIFAAFAAALSFILLAGCGEDRLPNVKPGPDPDPTPSKGTPLNIRNRDHNNINFTLNGEEWAMQTLGLDPYVWFDATLPVDFDKQYMLSFESFNASEPLPLVIFVGEACDNDHLLEGGDYVLPRTEGWSAVSFNLSKVKRDPAKPFRSVRVRFGMNGQHNFRIRNLMLRVPNQQEIDAEENAQERAKQEKELTARLKSYLSQSFSSTVNSVVADYAAGKITISGTTDATDLTQVGLAEIPMWEDQTKPKAVATFEGLAGNSFTLTFDRFAADGHDRLLSGWAIVRQEGTGYTLLSAKHNVDRIDNPRANLPKMVPASIKGIGGCPYDHADISDLNIATGTFNIILDQILFTDPGGGRQPYQYAGKTYYADINGGMLKLIDKDVKIAQQKNIMVSAILLLPVDRGAAKGTWLDLVAHPETEFSAAFSMPDMCSKEAVEAYAATMNFLCERYSGQEYGRIHHWIIHNEIQSGFYWTNAGNRGMETYMNLYERSMRLVQTLARQYDANAKSFISLDHGWMFKGSDRAYRGADMLNQLVKYSRQEGDFEWGVAFHPYPQDINNPRTWLDNQATFSFSTQFLTPRNLEVLDAWVDLPEVRYNGTAAREIQFTEQGINSPDYSTQTLLDQAAGVAYSLAKIVHMKHVTSYAYHLWADAHEEGGLRLGLRKYIDDPTDPWGKKPSWEVFRAFGQADWEAVTAPYLDIIGIADWNDVVHTGPITQ